MKKITQETLETMLEEHKLWLSDSGGKRFDIWDVDNANLQSANLERANLERAILRGANLEGANLEGAILRGAILDSANLQSADLEHAYLFLTNLQRANLQSANLQSANLQSADLQYANLDSANLQSANLIGTNLEGANLEGADLEGADLEGAKLKRANLESANLERANLEGANLEGANLTGTILDVFTTKPVKAYGRTRKAAREVQQVTHEMKLSAFKKAFPNAFEAIKHDIKSGTLSPESAQALIDRYGMTWQISKSKYKSSIQRLSPISNDVISLNIDIPLITDDKSTIDTLEAIRRISYQSMHPVHKSGPFTIGWIRYNRFDKCILVEEIQSDLPIVRKGISDEAFLKSLRKKDISEERIKETLGLLQPYVDRFYYDSLSIIFDIAHSAGLSVEMLSYEQKKEYRPPRSIYEELPKKMGMKKGTSSLDFIKGSVWKISPNPVRMGRLVVPTTWRRK